MTPDQWLERHFSGEFFSGNFEHLGSILDHLDLYPKESKVITIAGTNGKGETSRFISDLFTAHDKSNLLLTSPHLKKVNERFSLNGVDIGNLELVSTFENLKQKTQKYNLSYFEFLYLSFLTIAKKYKPYVLIQEVGLGGRLDATNAIDNDMSVLTSISRDHQEILGGSYRSILNEKLGIVRQGKQLVSSLELKYLRQQTARKVHELKLNWVDLYEEKLIKRSMHFSQANRLLALKAYEILEQEQAELISDINNHTRRKNLIARGASWDLFPTHNVDGLRKLIHFLGEQQYNNYDLVLFAPSSRPHKDLQSMGKILINNFSKENLRLVSFQHKKALERNKLIELKHELGLDIIDDIKQFKNLEKAHSILVLGSNYFLGQLPD